MGESTATIREDLVTIAVKFLENPRVQGRPRDEKETFLRKKGLNEDEIAEAFKVAMAVPATRSVEQYSAQYAGVRLPKQHPVSRWALVRDIGNTVLLLVGAVYGIHYVYQNYVGPFLFGKRKKSIEFLLTELNSNTTQMVGELTTAVERLTASVSQLEQRLNLEFTGSNERQELSLLKSEISSIKGILLGRKQFPTPPVLPSPAIPSWQVHKTSSQTTKETGSDMKADASSPLSSSPEILAVEEIQVETNKHATQLQLSKVSNEVENVPRSQGSSDASEIVVIGSGDETD